MIEPGIVALALANPAIAALIVDRFTPDILDDPAAYPAASYSLISTVDTYTLDGPLSLVQIRLQIDSWGATYAQAKSLAQALKALLNGYAGTLPNGVVVENIQRDGESGPRFDQTQRAYYVQTDWMIQYSEQ